MVEERITEHTDASGNTHTTHTIDTREGGGAGKWVLLLVIVVAIAVGAFLLMQGNAAEIAKDNAVAEAANDVGDAANQVGDAAQDAADAVSGN